MPLKLQVLSVSEVNEAAREDWSVVRAVPVISVVPFLAVIVTFVLS